MDDCVECYERRTRCVRGSNAGMSLRDNCNDDDEGQDLMWMNIGQQATNGEGIVGGLSMQ